MATAKVKRYTTTVAGFRSSPEWAQWFTQTARLSGKGKARLIEEGLSLLAAAREYPAPPVRSQGDRRFA
jgi:hypothetical protein